LAKLARRLRDEADDWWGEVEEGEDTARSLEARRSEERGLVGEAAAEAAEGERRAEGGKMAVEN